jgi:hypothetical protein
MDRRIYILPVASIVLILILISRPDITGFATAKPSSAFSEISAKASVTIASDGFIPEDADVIVYLDGKSGSMKFSDFVARTGAAYNRIHEQISQINFDGTGYGGEYTYALDISQFGIDTSAGSGSHTVVIEVKFGDSVLSSSSQTIEI